MYSSSTDIQYYTGISWPYPVDYDKTNYVECDLLFVGGGVAGCAGAVEATKRGAKAVIVDKGPLVRSGSAGAGIDHWMDVTLNPCSKVTPEKAAEWYLNTPYWGGKYTMAHMRYIHSMLCYETLLDLEKLGMKIRADKEFRDAPFTDPETGLMFAYDYGSCWTVRLKGGANLKPIMKKEVDRLGIENYEYVTIGHLLTEDGKTGEGARVIGAVGFSGRTGECYVFHAKAVIVCSGIPQGEWCHTTEMNGGASVMRDPNNRGEGQVMMAEAGAKLCHVEHSFLTCANGGMRWPMYGTGDCNNTWYGCPIVDATGKRIPLTQNGKVMNPDDRFKDTFPSLGDGGSATAGGLFELPQDLPERIEKGEFKLPFYADTPSMDPEERRVLWGLMIGNEGKTSYPIYKVYTANGFDPDKDMLQVPVMMPNSYNPRRSKPFWNGEVYDPWREVGHGSNVAVYGWDLKTTLDGLYVAGLACGNNFASGAYATGWHAARNAWKYAKSVDLPAVNEEQVAKWKEIMYAPIHRETGIGWKEFKAGCARVMQGNCGKYKSEEILQNGLDWFDSIENTEFQQLYARNPHELMRAHECYAQLFMSRLTLNAAKERKCSSDGMGFYRIDYPQKDDTEENQYYVTVSVRDGKIETGRLQLQYYMKPPYAPTYKENWEKYNALDS